MNQFYPIEAMVFIQEFGLPITYHNSNILNSCEFVIQVSENDNC